MANPYQIAVLAAGRARGAQLVLAGCTTHCYADFAEFRSAGLSPSAFVLQGDDPACTRRILQQLRRDPAHATALAFIHGAIDEGDLGAADGALPPHAQDLIERIEQTRVRAHAIRAKSDDRGPDMVLLEFMWLRPNYVLEPQADWRHPRRYRYPALEALDHSDSDPQTWLQRLDKRNLLERVALRDRQRECDHCGSAHLSFIDVCPNCRGIEVDQHAALHCFNCGLIAPEERFMRGEQRLCPKCGTRLRHIGSDYDRPLETNVCGSCDHVFVEGEVEARCAICRRSSPTTRLRMRKLYSWRLSGLGCLAAQGDSAGQAQALFEPRQYLPYPHFVGHLEWSLQMARESRSFSFALAGLHLENLERLQQALGAGRCAELLEACADRLRESLGDADLAARTDPETILLLFPNPGRRRLDTLHQAVRDLTRKAMQDGGVGPTWRLAEHLVSSGNADGEDARALLQRLRTGLRGEAARRVA